MRKIFETYMERFEKEVRSSRFISNISDRFVVVWTLLTRIPLPKRFWPEENILGKEALILSPIVGGVLGILTAASVVFLSILGIGKVPAIWLSLALYILLGWGIHLDGWSDLWDGFGSGKDGEELRSIMKDSTLGAFGVVGIILAVSIWTSLLATIPTSKIMASLIVASSTGRFAMCIAAFKGEYPWEKGLAKDWVDGFEGYDIFMAVICSLFFMPIAPFSWLLSMILVSVASYFLAKHMNKKLGGVNGDVLGAVAVLGELISIMVFTL